jgi:signal transduction histidine kinase
MTPELRECNEQLRELRSELEETNRGVVALYAELDQKAESLRSATELKSRFLANVSHEFRTPLHSMQSIAAILLEEREGPLTEGQRTALTLLRETAAELGGMVDELLDLAKIESGKVTVRAERFDVSELLGSIRALLRPLVKDGAEVSLVFDPLPDLPALSSDQSKIIQIVRNLASNALEFTHRGEVRIGARQESPSTVSFYVRDTGIGILPRDRERIFEEFEQVEGKHQKGRRGTGLGLPLSRKLARILGGDIRLESEPGVGSTFTLVVPLRYERGPGEPVSSSL